MSAPVVSRRLLILPSSVVVMSTSRPCARLVYTSSRPLGAKLGLSSSLVSVMTLGVPPASSCTITLNDGPWRVM